MRLTPSLVAVALVVPVLLTPTSPVEARAAAVPMCHGHAATVVVSGSRRIEGTPGPDVIVGSHGPNVIAGRGGDDVICGRGGADRLKGGPGDDELYGGTDAFGTFYGTGGRRVLTGDELEGGSGDDLLDPGVDHRTRRVRFDTWDHFFAGDRITYADSPRAVHVDLAGGTATGDGHDTIATEPGRRWRGLIGSRYADHIVGGPSRDYLDGRGGDDRVDGGAGADRVVSGSPWNRDAAADHASGGPGNDRIDRWGVAGHGAVDGGDGHDLLDLHGDPRIESVRLDVPGQTFRRAGVPSQMTGFETYRVHEKDGDVRFTGGSQADTLVVGARTLETSFGGGADVLRLSGASDAVVRTGRGSDRVFRTGSGSLDLGLGPGDDRLTATEGPPYLPRVVRGGAGHDVVTLDGNVNYHCSGIESGHCHEAPSPGDLCDGEVPTIYGTPGNDHLVGTPGPDVIAGYAGRDTIDGLGGNDVICGGTQVNDMAGGPGDDVLDNSEAHNGYLEGGPGNDVIRSGRASRVGYAHSPRGVVVDLSAGTAAGQGHDTLVSDAEHHFVAVIGSPYADRLTGDDRHQWFNGGDGDDVVRAGGGADSILEGGRHTGNDEFYGEGGPDKITTYNGRDTIDGGSGTNLVTVDNGTDAVQVSRASKLHLDAMADGDVLGAVGSVSIALGYDVELTVDLATRTITTGVATASYTSVGRWRPSFQQHSVVFSGGDEADSLHMFGCCGVEVRLGGGDDALTGELYDAVVDLGSGDDSVDVSARHSAFDGGSGTDTIIRVAGSRNTCTNFESGACNTG